MEPTERGVRLGKYALVAEIARGGMGIVYLAQSTGRHGFKKLVVVKQLKPELAEDERFREMFLDEASLAARLNHRNIVQTIEVDQDGDRYFFVMEYLEGRTLHHVSRLKGEKALPMGTILRIICDMLAGLHYAHELADYDGTPLGVVHRDVSPRNVFLTYDGQVKLLDFGVAKAAGRDLETETGELKGRVPYMAPEHVSDANIDRRADIFSTGVLLREALLGRRMWGRSSEIEILKELLQRKIPPLPTDARIDDEAKAIVLKAMAPNREDRYRTAHEMRAELERYVARIDPTGSFAKAGEHISREFAAQRAHVRAMIEEHVARAETRPPAPGDELPQLSISSPHLGAADTADPSNPSKPSVGRAPPPAPSSSNRAIPPPAPSPSRVVPTPPPSPVNRGAPPPAPSSSSAVAASAVPQQPPPGAGRAVIKDISIPPPPPPSQVGRYVLYGVGFVTVVAGLTVALLSTREPPTVDSRAGSDSWSAPTNTATGRPVPTPTESAAAPAEEIFEVTVFASPPVARIWIDNVAVGEGPHTAKYKRGSRHVVRASAPGYVTRTETIQVTATTSMNMVLEKEAGAPAPVFVRPFQPIRPAPPPSASAAPAVSPAPSGATSVTAPVQDR
ncbi:MAG TPA: serine/threonine-protein kinase [Labilithrix sp.]|nr:serine/threonine-protein kinase [Labilithrix sp.]